jgi:hypothetical protein
MSKRVCSRKIVCVLRNYCLLFSVYLPGTQTLWAICFAFHWPPARLKCICLDRISLPLDDMLIGSLLLADAILYGVGEFQFSFAHNGRHRQRSLKGGEELDGIRCTLNFCSIYVELPAESFHCYIILRDDKRLTWLLNRDSFRLDSACYWFEIFTEVKVEVTLRPTVSRPVRLGVRHSSGTRDLFFLFEIFFRQLQVCYFIVPYLTTGRVCNLMLLLVFASAVPRDSRQYFISWDSSNLKGQVPVFISPSNRVAQLYPRSLCSLSVATYDLQGYCGGILTRIHRGKNLYKVMVHVISNLSANRIEWSTEELGPKIL